MKVKTAEFKNNLSRYLHQVRENGVTIIICDRDRPVACLTPVSGEQTSNSKLAEEFSELCERFEGVGLTCALSVSAAAGLPKVKPSAAPDRRIDIATVEEMRRSKDW
jgi:prevent-host-death family protein